MSRDFLLSWVGCGNTKKGETMKALILIFTFSILIGCASKRETGEKSRLNKVFIEQNIKKHKTTKVQVVELLGYPEMVNSDSEGSEQWIYAKNASESDSNGLGIGTSVATYMLGSYVGADLGIDSSSSRHSTKSTTFTIYFTKKGKVKKYSFNHSIYN